MGSDMDRPRRVASPKTLEDVSQDTHPDTKLPGSLFYPRPRTFAALADSLEELLISKNEKSKTRFEDYLLDPVVASSSPSSSDLMEGKHESGTMDKEIESKLQPYPHPFKQLDDHSRQVLWSLVRTEYPRVLDALGEGMLVTSRRMTALNASSSSEEKEESEDAKKAPRSKRRQDRTVEEQQQQPKDEQAKSFAGFRTWRRLKSVMKDMERTQFVEERKQIVEEREKRFELLKGRKPT